MLQTNQTEKLKNQQSNWNWMSCHSWRLKFMDWKENRQFTFGHFLFSFFPPNVGETIWRQKILRIVSLFQEWNIYFLRNIRSESIILDGSNSKDSKMILIVILNELAFTNFSRLNSPWRGHRNGAYESAKVKGLHI